MAKRRRRMQKSDMKMMPMRKCRCGWWHMISGKLWGAAFILFLITVWPAAMALVHSIHWGWFLTATVLLTVLKMAKCRHCMM